MKYKLTCTQIFDEISFTLETNYALKNMEEKHGTDGDITQKWKWSSVYWHKSSSNQFATETWKSAQWNHFHYNTETCVRNKKIVFRANTVHISKKYVSQ